MQLEEDEVDVIKNKYEHIRSIYAKYTKLTDEEIMEFSPEELEMISKLIGKCGKMINELIGDLEDIIAVEDFLENGPKGKEP